jgi:hypothetical protein
MNELAAGLPEAAERKEFALGREARLFAKFALRCGEQIFSGCNEPLRDRPRARILLHPERPAGMDQEELGGAALLPEQEEPRADIFHGGRLPDKIRFS